MFDKCAIKHKNSTLIYEKLVQIFLHLVRNLNLYIFIRIYALGKELWYTDISFLTLRA
jgi:hypothetical protein